MHLWRSNAERKWRFPPQPPWPSSPGNACLASPQAFPGLDYCAATLRPCAARSRSSTTRQPLERLARCLIMQAVIFGMLGISELHRRNASPVHICCASALKAKLDVDETADKEAAKTRAKLTLRTWLLKKAVIVGSHWPRSGPVIRCPDLAPHSLCRL